MNVPQEGNAAYNEIKDDPARCAAYRAEYSRLTDARLLDANGDGQISSATINGQSFAMRPGMTASHRKAILGWVVKCLDNGGPISSTQISTF